MRKESIIEIDMIKISQYTKIWGLYMKKVLLCLLTLLALIFTGCTSMEKKSEVTGKTYTMVSPYANQNLTLTFTEDQISGYAGINRFFGPYKIKGENLELGPLGMTRMAGPLPEMKREDYLMEIINAADKIQVKGEFLTIFSKNGDSLKYKLQK